jgi:hypothetical protein
MARVNCAVASVALRRRLSPGLPLSLASEGVAILPYLSNPSRIYARSHTPAASSALNLTNESVQQEYRLLFAKKDLPAKKFGRLAKRPVKKCHDQVVIHVTDASPHPWQ